MKKENLKAKSKKNTEAPPLEGDDYFLGGRIGSAFMSTIEGQPHEDEDFVERDLESEEPEDLVRKFKRGSRLC